MFYIEQMKMKKFLLRVFFHVVVQSISSPSSSLPTNDLCQIRIICAMNKTNEMRSCLLQERDIRSIEFFFLSMSLCILSVDRSSDRIGETLCQILNRTVPSNYPPISAFCSSKDLSLSSTRSDPSDWRQILIKVLKNSSLSPNDLLGFLLLFDVATTSSLHFHLLTKIDSLLRYFNVEHPFQPVLTWICHAQPNNQLYTSALTCFNLSFILSTIYPLVQGVIFHSIDSIVDHASYHSTIAEQIGGIFRPVSSLREDPQRRIRSVSVEFLQLIQHLLIHPWRKVLILHLDPPVKKILQRPFESALLIERGRPSVNASEMPSTNLDIWYSMEEHSSRHLLVNSISMTVHLLQQLIIQPYQRKMQMRSAYVYWLKKKFSIRDEEFHRTIEFSLNLLIDQ